MGGIRRRGHLSQGTRYRRGVKMSRFSTGVWLRINSVYVHAVFFAKISHLVSRYSRNPISYSATALRIKPTEVRISRILRPVRGLLASIINFITLLQNDRHRRNVHTLYAVEV